MTSEPLNILHIDSESTWRGGENQLLLLHQGLIQLGHSSTIVTQPNSELAIKLRMMNENFVGIPMRSEFDFPAAIKISKVIKSKKIHIIHTHTAHSHSIGVLAKVLKRNVKLIAHRRVDFPLKKNIFSRMKYSKTDKVIAISEGVKNALIKSGIEEGRIAIVYSGIDLSKFDRKFELDALRKEYRVIEGKFIVGNIAHLAEHKGHKYLIESVKIVTEQSPDILFVIVGEGKLKLELKSLARKLGVNDKVIFTGFREDIPELLYTFDIFVLSSYLEGLCTSLMDAMAMRKAIVATNVGGIPEVVKDSINGILVPPKNPEKLAEAILALRNNEGLRKNMGTAGRSIVEEKFSSSRMVLNIEKVYYEVVK